MTQYNRDLEAGVTSNDVTLDDAVDGYQHNFTLHYIIIACDVITPVTTVIFGFGKRCRFKLNDCHVCFFLFR